MAGPQYVYHMQGVSKTYPGGKQVFENIHLSFLPDAKIGVVGVNGAGKSTLLKIMAGVETEFNGEAWAADGIKVGYLPQEPQLNPDLSVFENVASECPEKQLLDQFNAISMKLAEDYTDELMEEMTALQEQVDAADAWDIDNKIEMAMEALRCPPDTADVSALSGGEIRRVAICRLLLSRPDMILMDEPTNHLDAETVAWLQPDALISPWEFQAMLADEPAEEAPAAIVNLRPFELSLRDPAQCTCNEGAKKRRIKVPAPANAAVAHAIRHEPTREELADEFGDDAVPETEMRRLSVWLMTFALGIVALPAALALGVVSLFKGEDFRFATQVIALTVLAMSLETSGALAAILY